MAALASSIGSVLAPEEFAKKLGAFWLHKTKRAAAAAAAATATAATATSRLRSTSFPGTESPDEVAEAAVLRLTQSAASPTTRSTAALRSHLRITMTDIMATQVCLPQRPSALSMERALRRRSRSSRNCAGPHGQLTGLVF